MDGAGKPTETGTRARAAHDPHQRPRDAATLIILDASGGQRRILFGKRRMDQKFMPGKYVFPGGRIDASDVRLRLDSALAPTEVDKLSQRINGRPGPQRINAMALGAVRETFEETGLLLGRASGDLPATRSAAWSSFFSHGILPDLSQITFLARAITPPGKVRRYDTRFFCVSADLIAKKVDAVDGELTETHWLTLDEAKTFDLPTIQRAILEDLSDRLDSGSIGPSDHPVPFYHFDQRHKTFRRDLLTPIG